MTAKTKKLLEAVACVFSISILVMIASEIIQDAKKTPGYGWCGKCGYTWDRVAGHSTYYNQTNTFQVQITGPADSWIRVEGVPSDGEWHTVNTYGGGCFPLCEGCWKELATPEKRLPYYRALVDGWVKEHPESESKWEAIKESVMKGL